MRPREAGSPWAAPRLQGLGLLLLLPPPEGPQLHFRPRGARVGRARSAPVPHGFAAPVVSVRSDKSEFLRVCRAGGWGSGLACIALRVTCTWSLPHPPPRLLTQDPPVNDCCAATYLWPESAHPPRRFFKSLSAPSPCVKELQGLAWLPAGGVVGAVVLSLPGGGGPVPHHWDLGEGQSYTPPE